MIRSHAVSPAAPARSKSSLQARLALLTAGAMLASMSASSLGLATARADEKSDRRSKQYKIGAAVLGGAAVYFGLKKKNPVAAAAAGAGAYYAYKKGQDIKNKSERYGYDNSDIGDINAGDIYSSNLPSGSESYPDSGSYGDGSYSTDYGYGTASGDDYGHGTSNGDEGYASNGDQYPDYGSSGLKSRRNKASRSSKASRRANRIVVK